ncbi:hypothetical protein [Iningainema tapete]|uniref:Filamentous hemagglutinin outer membrane protein n=1 Tax=Iningainema tapete BLCC-T55 TaxID=2748662 RepID=A0A8J6XGU7_9CYAN|nr:hypothetical protein [Iningainema tapete]MBD2771821.1 hypothetical protein [Iningainema tapete BLCC-T55]
MLTSVDKASTISSFGQGDAGNINVDVTGAVTISGRKDGSSSAIGSTVESGAKGKGGNITISGGSFSLLDGALLSVSTLGEGNAGNIDLNITGAVTISGVKDGLRSVINSAVGTGNGAAGNLNVNARTIFLDNSTLSTDTRSRDNNPNIEQATINLQASDLVLLRRGSKITTNASGENIIGGNININTNFLVGLEDSDIMMRSRSGWRQSQLWKPKAW